MEIALRWKLIIMKQFYWKSQKLMSRSEWAGLSNQSATSHHSHVIGVQSNRPSKQLFLCSVPRVCMGFYWQSDLICYTLASQTTQSDFLKRNKDIQGGKRLIQIGNLFPQIHDVASFSLFTPEFGFVWIPLEWEPSTSQTWLHCGSQQHQPPCRNRCRASGWGSPAWGGKGDSEMWDKANPAHDRVGDLIHFSTIHNLWTISL